MTLRAGAVGALVAAVAALVTTLGVAAAQHHRLTRTDLVRFEQAVDPQVSRGGQVIEQGMKPAVGDLAHDHVTPPAFIAHEADGWIATLSDVRRRLAAVPVRDKLVSARGSLVAALDLYIRAAQTIQAAALASPGARASLIDRGVALAKQADTVFDRAAVVVQSERRRLHLGPSEYFPDPQG